MSDFIELILNIIRDILSLTYNLSTLFGYILGTIFFVSMIYLLVIRPFWGVFFDKGKRKYWLTMILLLLFGFGVGPYMVAKLNDLFDKPGIFIGLAIYLLGIWLIARPAIKRENQDDSHNY